MRDAQTPLDATVELAVQLEASGWQVGAGRRPDREGVLLAYTPPARVNPFQALLYSRALDHGVATLPVKAVAGLAELPWPGRVVCHLHWISSVLGGAQTPGEADDLVAGFVEGLDAVRRLGHRIVWTAHNALPHDARHLDHEIALRRELIGAADAVHVMTDDSVRLFREYAPLPEHKVFHVPHPTYAGAYPDFATRAEARSELAVRPEEFVFLLFGSLQPYKGVEELLEAFDRLSSRAARPVRLVVAGNAPDARFGTELRVWAAGRDDATAEIARVPIEDVQYYYRAADLAVLPYRRALNSGAAMLAITFGLPVLVAARDGLAGLAAMPGVLSYAPEEEHGLTDAMAAAAAADLGPLRRSLAAMATQLTPSVVSDAFVTGMLAMLGWPRELRRSA
ncbi:MAG: glycosyltransferase [Acidimicrobiales bacterium]